MKRLLALVYALGIDTVQSRDGVVVTPSGADDARASASLDNRKLPILFADAKVSMPFEFLFRPLEAWSQCLTET